MLPFSKSIAEQLKDMEDDSSAGIINHFNIAELVVREEADIQKIAEELERIQRRQQRAKGKLTFA